jgi:Aminomethyltransferase folate-binding domain
MVIPQKMTRRLLGSAELQSLQFLVRHASNTAKLRETCLYKFHVEKGAKMMNFAGFNMPVEYKAGIIGAHLHTRKHVSIFDVSHMLQTIVCGKDRFEFIGKAINFFVFYDFIGGYKLF